VPSSAIFNIDPLLPLTASLGETVCSHERCSYSTTYHKAASIAAKSLCIFYIEIISVFQVLVEARPRVFTAVELVVTPVSFVLHS